MKLRTRRLIAASATACVAAGAATVVASCTSPIHNVCYVGTRMTSDIDTLDGEGRHVYYAVGQGSLHCKGEYGGTEVRVVVDRGRDCYTRPDSYGYNVTKCKEWDQVAVSKRFQSAQRGDWYDVTALGDGLEADYRCKNTRDVRAYRSATIGVAWQYPIMRVDENDKRPGDIKTVRSPWKLQHCG